MTKIKRLLLAAMLSATSPTAIAGEAVSIFDGITLKGWEQKNSRALLTNYPALSF